MNGSQFLSVDKITIIYAVPMCKGFSYVSAGYLKLRQYQKWRQSQKWRKPLKWRQSQNRRQPQKWRRQQKWGHPKNQGLKNGEDRKNEADQKYKDHLKIKSTPPQKLLQKNNCTYQLFIIRFWPTFKGNSVEEHIVLFLNSTLDQLGHLILDQESQMTQGDPIWVGMKPNPNNLAECTRNWTVPFLIDQIGIRTIWTLCKEGFDKL